MATTGKQSPTNLDMDLQHLIAELGRVDVGLQRAVWRWRRAGQDPNDAFRGLHVSDVEVDALVRHPFGTNWGQTADLPPQQAQVFDQATQQAQRLIEKAQRQGRTPRFVQLASRFGLDRFDQDALLICLAPDLDLRYERIYAYLQNDVTRKRPSVNLILDLTCPPGPARLSRLSHFSDEAPLFKYHILERLPDPSGNEPGPLGQRLKVDEPIVAWLLGRYQPQADLGKHVWLSRPQSNPSVELLAAPLTERLNPNLFKDDSGSAPPILVFHGPDRLSQEATAQQLAAQSGRSLLTIDLVGTIEAGLSPVQALNLALRDARLTGAVLYLTGWDACLVDGALPPDLLAQLCGYPDWAIVASKRTWQPTGVERRRPLFWLEFPLPAYPQRHKLWQHFLAATPTTDDLDLAPLAGQFALSSGQIRDAVASAQDRAAQHNHPLQLQDLFAAARAHSNPHLGSLALKIEPRYTWADIVLPNDQLDLLHEIVATVRGRPLVLDEWGVGKKLVSSAGVTMLFAGPPGTGKTMGAEVIAGELGLDLYKIDLSTVVSKYIGETEKNLERIFNEAQSSNAILFFDEADAIFGKRSEVKDAHDRYANIEISYLLQRMEAYDGVTILATNLRANLDEAFTRRLQFAVDFPFPEEEDRLRIWQTLFPPDVPRAAELDFVLLARRFKLAGGNIRNIIVSAAYLAAQDGGQVGMKHLLHGTRRELQKMGRLVNEADMRTD